MAQSLVRCMFGYV